MLEARQKCKDEIAKFKIERQDQLTRATRLRDEDCKLSDYKTEQRKGSEASETFLWRLEIKSHETIKYIRGEIGSQRSF